MVLFAQAPLLRTGLSAHEYAGFLATAPGPVSGAWNGLSRTLFGVPQPGAGALALRLEQLVGLLACALALRSLLGRLLEPRLGAPTALRAGSAALWLLLVHPGALLAIADVGARADLAGLALALWAAALFLQGRQAHADAWTSASLVLFLVSGFASSAGAPLALVIAVAEFASVRRHRKRSLRLRTAGTTAGVFGAAALLPMLLRAGADSGGGGERWSVAGRTLMHLFLPSSDASPWSAGALAGGVLLAALWPAFRAARQAPRLWSGMLLVWSLGLGLALLAPVSRGCELPAVTAWCAGLGVTLGARASAGPSLRMALVLVGYAFLAHLQLRPLAAEARSEGLLWSELVPIVRSHEGPVLVVDPPGASARDLGWLFHPRVLAQPAAGAGFAPERVRGVTSAAFLALACSDELRALRAEGVTVVVPGRALGRSEPARLTRTLGQHEGAAGPRLTWRALTHRLPSPLDPLDWEAAQIVADLVATPAQIEQLGWDGVAGESGVVTGTVAERAGRLVSDFDLTRSLAWRLAGSVRGLRVEKGRRGIERAELSTRFPELPLLDGPRPRDNDWLLALPPRDVASDPGGSYSLSLLSLSDLELLELAPELEAGGNLRASGAEAFRQRKSPSAVAWVLDYRIGSRVLQRARGTVR